MRKLEQYQPEKAKERRADRADFGHCDGLQYPGISAQSGGFDSFFDLSKSRSPFDR